MRLTNRSRRIACIVALLTLAVALTTALLLAGERNAASQKKNVFHLYGTYSAALEKGYWGCAAA